MVTTTPYLPDIMAGVVARVSDAFSQREDDPFSVFFARGIINQVSRDVYATPNNYPLIWLIMNYPEVRGRDFSIYGEITCTIYIVAPTDSKFTQDDRETLVFKPRLIPVYEVFIQELKRERWFQIPGMPKHTRIDRPYWGGGDVNGTDQPNMFKKEVDAIAIASLQLRVRLDNCNGASYPVNPNVNYPPLPGILLFEDDIELIVNGGTSIDPLDGTDSVVIPSLIGRVDYYVVQRGFGKLRQDREVEIQKDAVNGGFSLLQGYQFKEYDTYVIRFRPRIVNTVEGLIGSLSKNVSQVFVQKN